MFRRRPIALIALLLAAGTFSADLAGAQDWAEMSPEDQQKMMQEWTKLGAPGEAHQHLAAMAGTWKTTTRVWMGGPGSEPMEDVGQSVKTMVLGGRWLQEDFTGAMMGQPMHGRGMTGYDNYKHMYINTWQDDASTSLIYTTGARHPGTGVFTFYGQADEPMLEVQDRTIKYTVTIENADRHVFVMYDLHAGDDYKVFEIVYERMN